MEDDEERLPPLIGFTSGGHAKSIELYGAYVVRQIGLNKICDVAKRLEDVAERYLHGGEQTPSDETLESLCLFISKACPNLGFDEIGFVSRQLVMELDACLLSYFSFHWHYAVELLDQVRGGERKLRQVVITATREQRFQKVMKTLKIQRTFSTLLEELKAMRGQKISSVVNAETDLSPAEAWKERSPVLLLIGGGMGAGKSTVVKDILQLGVWSGPMSNAVLVEADAFKETDVVYRALSTLEHGDAAEAAQLVHPSSIHAASSLLVAALNEGKDVIFDGTLSWEPFVLQTIAMARDVHRRKYRMGVGYHEREDGAINEQYWEPIDYDVDQSGLQADTSRTNFFKLKQGCLEEANGGNRARGFQRERKPYNIELIAVTCDAQVAVVRGIRRAVCTKRFVPIKGQLRSHKLFASSLEKYSQLVDKVKIYSTSWTGRRPDLIGWKNSNSKLIVSYEAFKPVKQLANLNPNAGSVLELYNGAKCNQVWDEVVLSADRSSRQELLRKVLGSDELQRSFSISSASSSDISLSSLSTASSYTNLSRESSISDFGSASFLSLSSSIVELQR